MSGSSGTLVGRPALGAADQSHDIAVLVVERHELPPPDVEGRLVLEALDIFDLLVLIHAVHWDKAYARPIPLTRPRRR
jgi:hypothetical protein